MGSRATGKSQRMIREHALPLDRPHPERDHKCRECLLFIAEKDVTSTEASRVPTNYCTFHQDACAPGTEACRRFKPRMRPYIGKKKRRKQKGDEVLWAGKWGEYPRIVKDKYGRESEILSPEDSARKCQLALTRALKARKKRRSHG